MSGLKLRNFGLGDDAALARVKAWTLEHFGTTPTQVVTVTEAACVDPGCPPRETIISFWDCGARATLKIHKAAVEVTRTDIARLSEVGANYSGGALDDC
jgi:nitrate reductase delta subunit